MTRAPLAVAAAVLALVTTSLPTTPDASTQSNRALSAIMKGNSFALMHRFTPSVELYGDSEIHGTSDVTYYGYTYAMFGQSWQWYYRECQTFTIGDCSETWHYAGQGTDPTGSSNTMTWEVVDHNCDFNEEYSFQVYVRVLGWFSADVSDTTVTNACEY